VLFNGSLLRFKSGKRCVQNIVTQICLHLLPLCSTNNSFQLRPNVRKAPLAIFSGTAGRDF
jgi:hypothetical protein